MAVIRSKKELEFYLMADRMMNRGNFRKSIRDIFVPDSVMRFLVSMRKYSYYRNNKSLFSFFLSFFHGCRFRSYSQKLGFSINCDSLGYGVTIPHYGTIVVGSNDIGNYAVLHTSTCISGNGKVIGDGLYLGTGAKITTKIVLGDNVSIGANSVVNKSFPEGNCLLVGTPAVVKKSEKAWWIRDGQYYSELVAKCEELKTKMGI